jgi:hypothetical protein
MAKTMGIALRSVDAFDRRTSCSRTACAPSRARAIPSFAAKLTDIGVCQTMTHD